MCLVVVIFQIERGELIYPVYQTSKNKANSPNVDKEKTADPKGKAAFF
jgi:hypothetical protein